MPISVSKNRTIRRKLGPNKKPLPGSEIISSSSSGKIKMPPAPGNLRTKTVISPDERVKPVNPPIGEDDEPVSPPIGKDDEPVNPPIGEDDEPVIPAIGEDDESVTSSVGINKKIGIGGGYGPPHIQTIEKTFHHKYTPERSRWWWVKYLCCFLLFALLLWILWCLYIGCPCKNITIDQTRTVYVERSSGKPIGLNGVKDVEYNETNISTGTLKMNAIQSMTENNISHEENRTVVRTKSNKKKNLPVETDQNTTNNNFSKKVDSSSDVNKTSPKESYEEKIERLKGMFKARVLPDNVEPNLQKVKKGVVNYKSIDEKSYMQTVDTFEVMPNEVTIKEYFYFANGNPGNYPEFWDSSTDDVRKNPNSKYFKFVCLEEECPIVGVSLKNIENYIAWLNRRVTNGHYELMRESQWHKSASYTKIDREVWYRDNSNNTTHPVISKFSNKYGIYNSYGNVAEIVRTKNGYVAVGGSWKSTKNELKQKYRVKPTEKNNWLGFRLVKMKDKKDKK